MISHREAIRYVLDTHIMFNILPDYDKERLEPLFELINFEENDLIADQGEPMDAMYFIYSGRVRLKELKNGKRVSLGELREEQTLGELSLIKPVEWPYRVMAANDVTTLKLPSESVRQLIEASPIMKDLFKRHIGFIELSYRLRGILGSAKYTPKQFSDILINLGIKKIPQNGKVFNEGDNDPRLYYIENGTVELSSVRLIKGEETKIEFERIYKGGILGEGGALSNNGVQPFTATALTDVTVLVIRQDEVVKILDINPELQEKLRERVKLQQRNIDAEISGRKRAEGVDLKIKLADAVTEEEFLAGEQERDISKAPFVRQSDEIECIAACMTMAAKYYGKEFTLGQIQELANLSKARATPSDIISAAELLGYNSKAYALRYEDLEKAKLPGIVGWEGYHYCLVYSVKANKVHMADPAVGLVKIGREEFEEGWTGAEVSGVATAMDTGVFIALDPTQKFLESEPPKKPILHFLNYILPFKKYFGEGLIAALTINLLGLASPLFIQNIVDTVVVHKDVSLLNMMLAGMVLVAIFKTITNVSQNILLAHTAARIDIKLVSEFYRHVLSLPMTFFLTRNKGEILARFGENAKIRALIAGSTITAVMSTLMVAIYFLVMSAYNMKLTLIVMVFIPLSVSVTLYFSPKIKALAQQIFMTNSQVQSYLIESLNGIESLKATANEYMARARWENAVVDNVNTNFKSQRLNLTANSLNQLVNLSSTVAILWVGANQVMAGTMSVGELMGFNMLMGMVMGPIQQLVGLWYSSQNVRIAIDRVTDILNVQPEQQPVVSPENVPAVLNNIRGEIAFHKVNFSYVANEKRNHVMRDFELHINPGERVALVGPSGCGKSTIAKMILGFNMPMSGECYIDGRDLKSLELNSLRRNIGVVLQDSFIFSGSVVENIALGDPEPNMQAVKEAARLAGADDFIINYPLGYQTLIGEKGMGISGGQRQRICIARSLYRKPKIMIFDEATSALDNESEARIQENMNSILAGRTSITIAHRLSTIINSDKICFIFEGKVAESGTHEELINPEYIKEKGYKGMYYQMAKTQFNLPPLEIETSS